MTITFVCRAHRCMSYLYQIDLLLLFATSRFLQTDCKQNCKQKLFQSLIFHIVGYTILCLHDFVCCNQLCKQTGNGISVFLLKSKQSSCLPIVDGIYRVEVPKDSLLLSGFILFLGLNVRDNDGQTFVCFLHILYETGRATAARVRMVCFIGYPFVLI